MLPDNVNFITNLAISGLLFLGLAYNLRKTPSVFNYSLAAALSFYIVANVLALTLRNLDVTDAIMITGNCLAVLGITSLFSSWSNSVHGQLDKRSMKACETATMLNFILFPIGTAMQLIFLPIVLLLISLLGYDNNYIPITIQYVLLAGLVLQMAIAYWVLWRIRKADLHPRKKNQLRLVGLLTLLQFFQLFFYALGYNFSVVRLVSSGFLLLWMIPVVWPGLLVGYLVRELTPSEEQVAEVPQGSQNHGEMV